MREQILISLVLFFCVGATQVTPAEIEEGSEPIRRLTDSGAVTKAIETFGLGEAEAGKDTATRTSVESVSLVDTTTPFLSQYMNGPALKVELYGVPLKGGHTRDFEVYFDPATGQLLKIVSTLPSYFDNVKTGTIKKPSPAEAERQLSLHSSEKYLGFSLMDPKPVFLEALNAVLGSPVRVDQIVAYFVEHERSVGGRQSVWVIEMYVGSVSVFGHHMRTVIDTSGNLVFGTNIPSTIE